MTEMTRQALRGFGRIVLLLLAVLLTVACDEARTYDHFEHVDTEGWDSADAVCFDVPRQSSGTYTMTLGLRHTLDYPYTNLGVVVESTIFPRRTVVRDTISCVMNDGVGKPTGQRGISVSEQSAGVRAFQLQQGDSLHVAVHHIMQRQELPGICEVGLRLEKQ